MLLDFLAVLKNFNYYDYQTPRGGNSEKLSTMAESLMEQCRANFMLISYICAWVV